MNMSKYKLISRDLQEIIGDKEIIDIIKGSGITKFAITIEKK